MHPSRQRRMIVAGDEDEAHDKDEEEDDDESHDPIDIRLSRTCDWMCRNIAWHLFK